MSSATTLDPLPPAVKRSLVRPGWIVIGVGWCIMLIPLPMTGVIGAVVSGTCGFVLGVLNLVRGSVLQGVLQLVAASIGTWLFYLIGLGLFMSALAAPHVTRVAQAHSQESPAAIQRAVPQVRPTESPAVPFPEPGTAHYFRPVTAAEFNAALTVSAPTAATGLYAVRFDDIQRSQRFMMVYLRAGQTLDLGLPAGSYTVTVAKGTHWYGDDALFGPAGTQRQLRNALDAAPDAHVSVQIKL